MTTGRLAPDIESIDLYTEKHLLLHGYIWPFAALYACWFSYWIKTLGATEYFELGLIGIAIIAVTQVITALFCFWFVSIRCLLMYRKVTYISCVYSPGKTCIPGNFCQSNSSCKFWISCNCSNFTYQGTICLFIYEKFTFKSVSSGKLVHQFYFQRLKYTFDTDDKESIHAVKFPLSWSLQQYKDWRGYASEAALDEAKEEYGDNQ